jgi:hypothetical protein
MNSIMASIISFFVLSLITYSYSVPVGKVYDSSTVYYEFTTDKTIVDRENTSRIPLVHGEQPTGTSNIHKKRFNPVGIPPKQTVEEHHIDIDEESTPSQEIDRRRQPPEQGIRSIDDEESHRVEKVDRRRQPPEQNAQSERSVDEPDNDEISTTDVYRPSRTFEESSFPSITITSTTDVSRPSRTFEESSFPSITSTVDYSSSHEEHDNRSFKDEFSTQPIETSTEFSRRAIRPIIKETSPASHQEIQLLTRNLSENNIETTTNLISSSEPSSSVDSFGEITGLFHNSSNEISTTTQSSFVTEHFQQLNQGQKQPIVEKKKPN